MKQIVSSIEIVEVLPQGARECEVCATAEATHDEVESKLTVVLESFLRIADIRIKEVHESASWLPPKQTVQESVSRREALDVADDIFHRWVGKVRQSIPSTLNCQSSTNNPSVL